jgi:hypothetical protein
MTQETVFELLLALLVPEHQKQAEQEAFRLLHEDATFPAFLIRAPRIDPSIAPISLILFRHYCSSCDPQSPIFPALVTDFLSLIADSPHRSDLFRFFVVPVGLIWAKLNFNWDVFPNLLRAFETDPRFFAFSLELACCCYSNWKGEMISYQADLMNLTHLALTSSDWDSRLLGVRLFLKLPSEKVEDLGEIVFNIAKLSIGMQTAIFDPFWCSLFSLSRSISAPFVILAQTFLNDQLPHSSQIAIFNFLSCNVCHLSFEVFISLLRLFFLFESEEFDETIVHILGARAYFPDHDTEIIQLVIEEFLAAYGRNDLSRGAALLLLPYLFQYMSDLLFCQRSNMFPFICESLSADDVNIVKAGLMTIDWLLLRPPIPFVLIGSLWKIAARHSDSLSDLTYELLGRLYQSMAWAPNPFKCLKDLLTWQQFAAQYGLMPLFLHLLSVVISLPFCLPTEEQSLEFRSLIGTFPSELHLSGAELAIVMFTRDPEFFADHVTQGFRFLMEAVAQDAVVESEFSQLISYFFTRLQSSGSEFLRPYYPLLLSRSFAEPCDWWAFGILGHCMQWDFPGFSKALKIASIMHRAFIKSSKELSPIPGMIASCIQKLIAFAFTPDQIREFLATAISALREIIKIPQTALEIADALKDAIKILSANEDVSEFVTALGSVFDECLTDITIASNLIDFEDVIFRLAGILLDYGHPSISLFFSDLQAKIMKNKQYWFPPALHWFSKVIKKVDQPAEQEFQMMSQCVKIGWQECGDSPHVMYDCYQFIENAAKKNPAYGLEWLPELEASWPEATNKFKLANCLWTLWLIEEGNEKDENFLIEMLTWLPLTPKFPKGCAVVIEFCQRNAGRYPEFQFHLLHQLLNIVVMYVFSPESSPFGTQGIQELLEFCRTLIGAQPMYFERLKNAFQKEPNRFARLLRWLGIEL